MICKKSDIFSTHTNILLVARTRSAHTFPIFFIPTNHYPCLSVYFHPISLFPVSTIQTTFSFFPFMVTHKYMHILLHPQHSLPNVLVSQWEGGITISLLLSTTAYPSSSCLSSNPICPSELSNTHVPYTCRLPQLLTNRIWWFQCQSRDCKAAQ